MADQLEQLEVSVNSLLFSISDGCVPFLIITCE